MAAVGSVSTQAAVQLVGRRDTRGFFVSSIAHRVPCGAVESPVLEIDYSGLSDGFEKKAVGADIASVRSLTRLAHGGSNKVIARVYEISEGR